MPANFTGWLEIESDRAESDKPQTLIQQDRAPTIAVYEPTTEHPHLMLVGLCGTGAVSLDESGMIALRALLTEQLNYIGACKLATKMAEEVSDVVR